MINEPTLFILGAGSSVPYGYSTGRGLRKKIIEYFPSSPLDYIQENNSHLRNRLINREKERANYFANTFKNSSTPSIDLFLARSPEFIEIGKKAIAFIISEEERNSKFDEDVNIDDDWLGYLYCKMSETLTTPESYKDFANNKVSFITFNYDRSLEYFLYKSLTNSFSKINNGRKTFNELIPFKFIHAYGKLSDLPCESKNGVEYKIEHHGVYVDKMSKNIHTVHEHNPYPEEEEYEELKVEIESEILKAKYIFFLGFGYAQENLSLLNIPEVINSKIKIFGTALGFTKKEIDQIKLSLCNNEMIERERKGLSSTIIIENLDCKSLLREYL